MISTNEELLRAAINLDSSPDFQVVIRWFRESQEDQLRINSMLADEVKMRWGQGKAQNLDDILSTLTDARRIYGMMKR